MSPGLGDVHHSRRSSRRPSSCCRTWSFCIWTNLHSRLVQKQRVQLHHLPYLEDPYWLTLILLTQMSGERKMSSLANSFKQIFFTSRSQGKQQEKDQLRFYHTFEKNWLQKNEVNRKFGSLWILMSKKKVRWNHDVLERGGIERVCYLRGVWEFSWRKRVRFFLYSAFERANLYANLFFKIFNVAFPK